MNKRITKKRFKEELATLKEETEAARINERIAHNVLRWTRQSMAELQATLEALRSAPAVCSYRNELDYMVGGVVHTLTVNSPLRIDHRGPLLREDAERMARELSAAVHDSALSQILPFISERSTR